MTSKEVTILISSMGFPYRYSHFSQTPNPPYVVYYYPNEDDVYGDNSNYVNKRRIYIELYTETKDVTSEAAVESALAGVGMTWYKQTDFLNDEQIYQTTYESEVIINGQ